MDYTQEDINSLADKLEGMDLTEGESAALIAIVSRSDDEVEGFLAMAGPASDDPRTIAGMAENLRKYGTTITPKGMPNPDVRGGLGDLRG